MYNEFNEFVLEDDDKFTISDKIITGVCIVIVLCAMSIMIFV